LIIQVSEREKVPRVRTTAIAALAVSALLATSGAAYAHDLNLKRSAGEASAAPSMSWAHFSGELTDYTTTTYTTATPDLFKGARATAMMFGINGETTFRLHVSGIAESANHHQYPAHLHKGPCVAEDPSKAGGHYNNQEEEGVTDFAVNAKTEVWLNFKVSSEGNARITVTVPFVPKPGDRSIVIHSDQAPMPPATSPTRLACLPLEIKSLSSTD